MQGSEIANGPITNWLAIIGVISLIYWGWRIGAALMNRGRKEGEPSKPSAEAAVVRHAAPALAAPTHEGDIAAIAAAVYSVLGAHRIVHLEAASHHQNWAVEGRWMQQTSHRPQA